MITITIESELMSQVHRVKTDAQSIAYLKKVKKMHSTKYSHDAGPKPKRWTYGKYGSRRYKADMDLWRVRSGIKSLKVSIERN